MMANQWKRCLGKNERRTEESQKGCKKNFKGSNIINAIDEGLRGEYGVLGSIKEPIISNYFVISFQYFFYLSIN